MKTIRKATAEDAVLIHELAHAIWYPTYGPILSQDQIAFMLEKMYATEVLEAAILEDQVQFYLLCDHADNAVGFLGLQPKADCLRIEKIYLLPITQGKGYGKLLIEFSTDRAKELGLPELELNVNRGNQAYHFYLKQGFEVVEEVDIPYYGYVMDDYVMRKRLIS